MTDTPGSCAGCKFLFGDGSGYSNYTWLDTYLRCALSKNRELLAKDTEAPFAAEAGQSPETYAQLPELRDSRCEAYAPGRYIVLDPDREIELLAESEDPQQIWAIWFWEFGQVGLLEGGPGSLDSLFLRPEGAGVSGPWFFLLPHSVWSHQTQSWCSRYPEREKLRYRDGWAQFGGFNWRGQPRLDKLWGPFSSRDEAEEKFRSLAAPWLGLEPWTEHQTEEKKHD